MSYTLRMIAYSYLIICITSLSACANKKSQDCGTVIILNGPSAVGKTSIIKAFQAKQATPWLGIGIDNFFVSVLPQKYYLEDKPAHHTVMHGIATEDEHGKLFTLTFGSDGERVIHGMHRAIAAYAQQGNNVIVDYISYKREWLDDLRTALDGINVITVGVTASLPTIEAREKSRTTSPEGHARSHYYTVHEGWMYNLEINTDNLTPEDAADKIITALKIRNMDAFFRRTEELGHILRYK